MNERYYKAIKEGIAEYQQLSNERVTLEARMQKVLQLVAANLNMLPDTQQEPFLTQLLEMRPPKGWSEAIIRILDKGDTWLSPTEVRDALAEGGYDFTGQANPLASIHTTLKRLVDGGDAIVNTPQPDGKTYYKRSKTRRGINRLATLAELMRPNPALAGLGYTAKGISLGSMSSGPDFVARVPKVSASRSGYRRRSRARREQEAKKILTGQDATADKDKK